MSSKVIEVSNVSKTYRLGHFNASSFKEEFLSFFGRKNESKSNFHSALNDLSFDVYKGDILALVGKNGAGKSTILKILSKVTLPTSGEIKIKGKVASLLEVGTGFHAELTAKENIYLNGAILGLKKQEIDKSLDSIIDYSGVEKYIDTPIKRFSSGMLVRLAFSVASHLRSDILIADEVLAVGDTDFQKKCIGRMKEVSEQSNLTILFVSHNIPAIESLCTRALLLEKGTKTFDGSVKETLNKYLASVQETKTNWKNEITNDNDFIQIIEATIKNKSGEESNNFSSEDNILLSIKSKILSVSKQ